jgi:hypothetical protein
LKKIVNKGLTKVQREKRIAGRKLSQGEQTSAFQSATSKRLTQIACGKALKEAGITDSEKKKKIHRFVQGNLSWQVISKVPTTKTNAELKKAIYELERIIDNPIQFVIFLNSLTGNQSRLGKATGI